MGKLLQTAEGADVAFKVQEETFRAHRVVLAARSPVFEAELYGPLREKSDGEAVIPVEDVHPDAFRALLHFIYTDSLPGDGEGCDAATLQHLLVAADRYGVDRLKHICEGKLRASADEKTVASMLAIAERHNCPRLRDACLAIQVSIAS